jgi:hypothetical protein
MRISIILDIIVISRLRAYQTDSSTYLIVTRISPYHSLASSLKQRDPVFRQKGREKGSVCGRNGVPKFHQGTQSGTYDIQVLYRKYPKECGTDHLRRDTNRGKEIDW